MQKTTARSELIRTGNIRPVSNLMATFIAVTRARPTNVDAINARRAEMHKAPVRKFARIG